RPLAWEVRMVRGVVREPRFENALGAAMRRTAVAAAVRDGERLIRRQRDADERAGQHRRFVALLFRRQTVDGQRGEGAIVEQAVSRVPALNGQVRRLEGPLLPVRKRGEMEDVTAAREPAPAEEDVGVDDADVVAALEERDQ